MKDSEYPKRRIALARKDARRAVDLILHGAAAELTNEDFVPNEMAAWKLLGEAVIEEILDHGFALSLTPDGNPVLRLEN